MRPLWSPVLCQFPDPAQNLLNLAGPASPSSGFRLLDRHHLLGRVLPGVQLGLVVCRCLRVRGRRLRRRQACRRPGRRLDTAATEGLRDGSPVSESRVPGRSRRGHGRLHLDGEVDVLRALRTLRNPVHPAEKHPESLGQQATGNISGEEEVHRTAETLPRPTGAMRPQLPAGRVPGPGTRRSR